jgi:acyl-CoA dehydrogenase-like protein
LGHYKSNVRDLEFNLFEVLDLEKALATGEFGDLDAESVRQTLDEASRLVEGPLRNPLPKPTAARRHSTPRHIR